MDIELNVSSNSTVQCPELGRRWWAFLGITSIIYTLLFSTSLLISITCWLIVKYTSQSFKASLL